MAQGHGLNPDANSGLLFFSLSFSRGYITVHGESIDPILSILTVGILKHLLDVDGDQWRVGP